MTVNHTKFSIITPSYNQGPYLEKTIQSVIEQDYPNLEYIIIDGGSTDNSLEIIKKYEKYLTYWVSEKDRGQSHAINKGFEHASGDLLGWLNSDDFYAPDALKIIAEVFQANPTVGAIVGAGDMVDANGRVLCSNPPFPVSVEALYCWVDRFFWQPSCFFTKEAWELCGPLAEEYHFAMDLDLWLKIAEKFRFATTDAFLSSSLKHENAKTTAYAMQSIVDASMVIMAHGGEKQARENLVNYIKSIEERHTKEIENIRNSLSWKMTAPLRSIGRILRKN